MKIIDLRSDTVTRPVSAMKYAMFEADLGDDVYGEDPTVNKLEATAAEMFGKEAALFASSGTQTNLLALMSHCQRGDEYIVGQDAHTYKYEAGGAAVLGSIQPQPLSFEPDGSLDLDRVESLIKPRDCHFARSRLLCLENTVGGKVLPLDYLHQARQLIDKHQLALHLDGARIFNAAVAMGIDVKSIAEPFDSVSVCLSKGLGAPVGSVLVGSRELIQEARHWRKMLGGGMRQAGGLAAAGLYALEHHVARLAEDHRNAELLAEGLSAISQVELQDKPQTNMLFIRAEDHLQLVEFLRQRNILVSADWMFRLVTHLDIDREDIEYVIQSFEDFYQSPS